MPIPTKREPIVTDPRATLPRVTLLQGFKYRPASHTDVRATFEAIKAEATKPANVQRLSERRRSK